MDWGQGYRRGALVLTKEFGHSPSVTPGAAMRDAISPHDLRRAPVRTGLLKEDVRPASQPLSGGVSSDVVRVDFGYRVGPA